MITNLDRFYKLSEKFNDNLAFLCLYLNHIDSKYTPHKYYSKLINITQDSTSIILDTLIIASQKTSDDIEKFINEHYHFIEIDNIDYIVDFIKMKNEIRRLRKELKYYKKGSLF